MSARQNSAWLIPGSSAGGGSNPPAQDYVTDCAEQRILYDLLNDALTALGG